MNVDLVGTIATAGIFALIILFIGEPDMHDAILCDMNEQFCDFEESQ